MPDIPSPDAIDSNWLTTQLQANGFDVEVKGFKQTRIGTGQIGMCIRYDLEYKQKKDAPTSLVGKFASPDPLSSATGVQLRNYIKEVRFYQSLKDRLSIKTPDCLFAEIEGEGPVFVLLLEDLAPAQQGDQLSGCDETVARAALAQLVGLHAPSWCDSSLRNIDWLGEPAPEPDDGVKGLYQSMLPGFLDRYGAHLTSDQIDIITKFGESNNLPVQKLPDPFSLIHIDYRLDNILIDSTTTPPEVAVVDWQSITLGNPLTDVAYFLGAGMLPEDRRRSEDLLVRRYHHDICSAIDRPFSWEDCWSNYRLSTFAGFSVTVIASMLVQQTERGDAMFIAMAQRHSQHALDLGAEQFL